MEKLNVRCMGDSLITTVNTRKVTASGLIITDKEMGEVLTRQTVLVAGPHAGVVAGEEIEINTSRFPRKNLGPKQVGSVNDIGPDRFEVIVPIEKIDGKDYLFLNSTHIKFVYTKEE